MGNLAKVGLLESGGDSPFMFSGPDPAEAAHKPGLLARAGQILSGVPGGLLQLGSDIARLPFVGGQAIADGDFGERFPAVFGMAKGFEQTAHHLNPLEIKDTFQDYKDDPLGAALNDVGNVATVASLGAAGAAKVGLTAGGGLTGAGGAAGARAATVAGRLEKIAASTNKVADIPLAPYRFALTRGTEALGRYGLRQAEAGSTSALHQGLVRFSPEGKALNNSLLSGTARERHEPMLRPEIRAETSQAISGLPFAQRGTEVPTSPDKLADWEAKAEAASARAAAATAGTKGAAKAQKAADYWADRVAGAQSKVEFPDGTLSLGEASGHRLGKGENIGLTTPLASEVSRFFRDPQDLPGAKGLSAVLGPTNRLHRSLRLNLNPGWAFGQAPGNAVMGAAGSSAPLRYVRQFASDLRTGNFEGTARTHRSALDVARQEAEEGPTKGLFGKADKAARWIETKTGEGLPLGRSVEKGGRGRHLSLPAIADRMDNASRSAFYKTEVKQGASPAVAEEGVLRHMGEFDKKNAAEAAYASKLSPFYTWNREIVKITAKAAERHPVGATQVAGLGRIEADEPEPEPGERKLDGGFLIPFGQVGTSFGGTMFGAGKQLGPVPKLAAMIGTGNNMTTGKDLRVGQEFGESNTPGLHNAAAGWSTIWRNYPTMRTLTAAKGENRYQTPGETLLGVTGVEVSHAPTEKQLAEEKASRASDRQDNKIRALTEAAKAGR